MPECRWGHNDCTNTDHCFLCSSESFYYKPKKKIKPKAKKAKQNNRPGSLFEAQNDKSNQEIFNGTTSRATPNSGAGHIKGDEEILGLVNAMEELKERDSETSKGEKTFSMHKEWFDKLKREALHAGKEFWYLKFRFGSNESESYVAMSSEMNMSMIYTMAEDRKERKRMEKQLDFKEKQRRYFEAKCIELEAQVDMLKTELELAIDNGNKTASKSK